MSKIHEGLVGRRALVGTPYLADRSLRAEYEREIAPRTEVALAAVIDDLGRHGARVAAPAAAIAGPRRVLDLGAGTGAVGRVVRARWPSAVVVGVDRVAGPEVAVVAELSPPSPVRPRGVEGRFDWIVAAHLLNEWSVAPAVRAERVAAWARDLLEPGGVVVLIEPAVRETSRDLLTVRDELLAGGALRVVSPCFFAGPCPALARPRDWCHASTSADGAWGDRVDWSHLVLAPSGPVLAAPGPAATAATPSGGDARSAPRAGDGELYRIVSDRLRDKGRVRYWGCGPSGRHELVRLDRHRGPANAAWDSLARGDVVVLGPHAASSSGVQRLDAGSTVEVLRG